MLIFTEQFTVATAIPISSPRIRSQPCYLVADCLVRHGLSKAASSTNTAMKSKTRQEARRHTHLKKTKTKPRTPGKLTSKREVVARNVTITPSPDFKVCQEVEIGDIGGFGDTAELEQHEKKCGDRATEYCMSCGKNLCQIHYMLMHGDHNVTSKTVRV